MQLTGAEILIRCLQEEGVEYVFGYPGGAVLYIYDELFKQDKRQARAGAPRAGAPCTRPTAIRARSTKVGVALVTSGPGRDQRRHRHRHRVHGLDPDGDHHRPGADARDRPGRVPGVRHGRHHAAVRQAQLPGQGRRATSRSTMKKAFHIATHRPPGPGGGRHPEGRDAWRRREFDYPKTVVDALVQPGDARATPARSRRRCSCCSTAKRPMIYTGGGVILGNASRRADASWSTCSAFPCTNTLMGLGALSRRPTRSSSACSACTAPTKRTWRCSTATCCSPIGARFDDRVIGNPKHFVAEPRARSSTSTSIRRRSPSA